MAVCVAAFACLGAGEPNPVRASISVESVSRDGPSIELTAAIERRAAVHLRRAEILEARTEGDDVLRIVIDPSDREAGYEFVVSVERRGQPLEEGHNRARCFKCTESDLIEQIAKHFDAAIDVIKSGAEPMAPEDVTREVGTSRRIAPVASPHVGSRGLSWPADYVKNRCEFIRRSARDANRAGLWRTVLARLGARECWAGEDTRVLEQKARMELLQFDRCVELGEAYTGTDPRVARWTTLCRRRANRG